MYELSAEMELGISKARFRSVRICHIVGRENVSECCHRVQFPGAVNSRFTTDLKFARATEEDEIGRAHV